MLPFRAAVRDIKIMGDHVKKYPAILAAVLAVSITAVLSGCAIPGSSADTTSASASTSANPDAVKPGVTYKLAGIPVEDSAYEQFGAATELVPDVLEGVLKELHSHPEFQKSNHIRKESDVKVFADGGLESYMDPTMWKYFAEGWVEEAPLWPYAFDPEEKKSGEKSIDDVFPTSEGLHAVYDGSKAKVKLVEHPEGGHYLEVSRVTLSWGVNTTDNRTVKGSTKYSYSFFPVFDSSDNIASWSLVSYEGKDSSGGFTDEKK